MRKFRVNNFIASSLSLPYISNFITVSLMFIRPDVPLSDAIGIVTWGFVSVMNSWLKPLENIRSRMEREI